MEEELNLIREEPEFRNMTIEEYKEILDIERDMIRNLNLWDMDYLDSEQLFRMKKLTSHFNFILEMRRQMRESRRRGPESRRVRRTSRSRSRSRSRSGDSLRSYDSLDDLKDRYIDLKHTYYEALRAGHHINLNPDKYKYNNRKAGGYNKSIRNQEYRTPYKDYYGSKKSNRSRSKGSSHRKPKNIYGRGRSRSIDDNQYYRSKPGKIYDQYDERSHSRYMGNNEFIDVYEYEISPSERKRQRNKRKAHGYASRFRKLKNMGARRY